MAPSSTNKLASGREIPLVGFGLLKVPAARAAETVYNAINASYRLFDGAYDYQNEKQAGEGIQRAIREGILTPSGEYSGDGQAPERGLGLGYINLYLIHFPVALKYIDPEKRRLPAWWMDDAGTVEPDNVPTCDNWEALETAFGNSIARSIGVSNFSGQSLYDLQCYAPTAHCPRENHFAVIAYSSFSPQSFFELPSILSQKAAGAEPLLESSLIKSLTEKHGKTPAQIFLRWATQYGIAFIPKSNSHRRLAQNLDVLSFGLEQQEIESISALDRGWRFNDWFLLA